MSLPTLSKIWQFQVNQRVFYQGTSNATEKRLIRTIKNLMKGFSANPWTCSGSSNSSTAGMDGSDRWTTDADITKAASASPHSWIVLRQTGIATNYEVCLDMNTASPAGMSIVVSPSAGFTGGTTSARPTATDEISLITTSTWTTTTTFQSFIIHAMQSTDGQCTRIQVWRAGNHQPTFWIFDKPQNVVTGWTNPSISLATAQQTSGLASDQGTNLEAKNLKGRGTVTFSLQMTGEYAKSFSPGVQVLAGARYVGSMTNAFDNIWPFFPIGIAAEDSVHQGRHGNIFDLWWKPLGIGDGDTFPSSTTNRQFVALGGLMFPWTGDGTIPLLA